MMQKLDAPIAGANYAADTRNYPWHRPPDITSYDEGVDYLITKMQEPEELELVYALLEIDATIATVVTSVLMQGISRGKFSIDLAILMSGPVARYIGILADEQEIKYDMGVGDDSRIKITPTSLKLALGIVDDVEEVVPEDIAPVEPIEAPMDGLMGAPSGDMTASDEEQAAMLGGDDDTPEVTEEPEDGLA
jgi:hypothetical protein|tara:strand:+ start:203 stop:778 length:576 start_codon:yes stop_codon:yes gene_type:complete